MPHGSNPIDPSRDPERGGTPTRDMRTGTFAALLLAFFAVALGARLFRIDAASFWNDELYSVVTATDMSGTNLSKRLGYVPTKIALLIDGVDLETLDVTRPETWIDAGIDETALRWPHALIGALTIPLLMLCGRRALGDRGAAALGALLAVAPWHVYWSQAARFYVLQFLFFNMALLLWMGSARDRRPIMYALAMACAFLGFWSQPQAMLVFAVMGLDWIISYVRKDPIKLAAWQWVVGGLSVIACGSLMGLDLTQRTEQWSHFVGGARWHTPQGVFLAVVYFVWPTVAAFGGLAGLWLLSRHPRAGWPLAIGAALPPLLFIAAAPFAFIGSRYAFICLGAALAIVGVGAARIFEDTRNKVGILLAAAPGITLVVAQVVSLMIYFRSGGNFHVPMRDVATYIARHNEGGHPVYAHEDEVIRYYAQTANVAYLPSMYEFGADEIEALTEPAWFVFEVSHEGRGDVRSELPGMTFVDRYTLVQIHSSKALDLYWYDPAGATPAPGAP